MAASRRAKELCKVNGRFQRTIGKFVNAKGNLAPKKFLLGTDKQAAELASVQLERLWADIIRAHEASLVILDLEKKASEEAEILDVPRWDTFTLKLAEAIRLGQPSVEVAVEVAESIVYGPAEYARDVYLLRQRFPSASNMIVPADPEIFKRGQTVQGILAKGAANSAAEASAIAEAPLPRDAGGTFYRALDECAAAVRDSKVRDGKVTAWGESLARSIERLKDSSADVLLDDFGYQAIENICNYWRGRPAAKKTGRPIAVDSVKNHLKGVRHFIKWLHRTSNYHWQQPTDVEETWKFNAASIMHENEIAALKNPVKTFTIEDLRTLFVHADELERMLILLGLNFGFAQAECVSLRSDEIDLAENRIKRVRRKTRVYGEFSIWPETRQAIEKAIRCRTHRGGVGEYFLVNNRGERMTDREIARRWRRLLNRISKGGDIVEPLSFKFLRKTAGQMIRNVSDGEVMGIFHSRGTPVPTDDLSDRYSNRPFRKVFEAQAKVRELLEPMLEVARVEIDNRTQIGGTTVTNRAIHRIH